MEPCLNTSLSTGDGKRRRIYDLTSKKQIVTYAEKYGNRAAGRFYNIAESCIRSWRKSLTETTNSQGMVASAEESLSAELPELPVPVAIVFPPDKTSRIEQTNMEIAEVSSEASMSIPDVPWYVHLGKELRDYVRQLYKDGSPVLLDEILLKAYDIIMSLNISRQEFEISREWVKSFLKYRSSVSCQISKSPRVVQEIETKIHKYHNVVTQLRRQHNYPLNQIGNVHQIKVFLDYSPSDEKCITVMLCATADGSKLPLFIVFKCDSVLNKALPRNVIVRTEESGNMTSKLMTEWYKLVWGCRIGVEYNPRAMLTLDYSVSNLLTEDWLKEGNTDLIVIPKGMNLIPQPLNVHIHKAFKDNLRWEFEKWLLSRGRLKSASASLILCWIAGAWKNIPEEMIINSFKNCHLSGDLDNVEAEIYSISENYVVFHEEISIGEVNSLGVSNDGSCSSFLPDQETDSASSKPASSNVAVESGVIAEGTGIKSLEHIKKHTQDPLAIGAHEEKSILKKLLNDIQMEVHSEDCGSETNATLDKVSNQQENTSTSTSVPPKVNVVLMMHNGNVVMLEDVLPSTIEQKLCNPAIT